MQHQAKKRFGQNFLVDQDIINHIVDSIQPEDNDLMIEIGPGLGAMTLPLLVRLNKLHVIELDRDVIPKLIGNCKKKSLTDKLHINEKDVLKFDFENFWSIHKAGKHQKLRVVGNLPYNISTPVLFHLLSYRHLIQDMHFMLQKEVVERIVSEPGNKHYGRLSVMMQTFCDAQFLFEVPPHAFQPAPKVDSAILRLIPHTRYENNLKSFSEYEKLVRQSFSQRRKTIRNTLKPLCNTDQIINAGLEPSLRAESLTVQDFIALHQQICQA